MRRIARRGGAVDGIRYEMNAARVGRGFPVCAACFVLLGDATGKRGAAALDECRVRLGEAGLPGRCPCWRACCAASTWGVCYSALTRKSDIRFHGIVKLCAGERWRLAGFSSGRGVCARGGLAAGCCISIAALYVCLTPAVCRPASNRTACDMLRSDSRAGGIACSAFSRRCGVIGSVWFI